MGDSSISRTCGFGGTGLSGEAMRPKARKHSSAARDSAVFLPVAALPLTNRSSSIQFQKPRAE